MVACWLLQGSTQDVHDEQLWLDALVQETSLMETQQTMQIACSFSHTFQSSRLGLIKMWALAL
jgi:hypothetical protein